MIPAAGAGGGGGGIDVEGLRVPASGEVQDVRQFHPDGAEGEFLADGQLVEAAQRRDHAVPLDQRLHVAVDRQATGR